MCVVPRRADTKLLIMAEWFVIIDGVEHGPMSPDKLRAAVNKGTVTAETLVRKGGMDSALPAGQIKGLIKQSGTGTGTGTQRRSRRQGGTGRQKRGASRSQQPSQKPAQQPAPPAEPAVAADDTDPYRFDAFEKSENFVKQVESKEITKNFFLEAAKAFMYPFSPNAIAFALGYVVLALLFVYAGIFLINAWFGFQYIFFALSLWFILYAFAYLMRIAQRSAAGDLRPPVFPQLGAFMDEILGPAALCIAGWVILRLPYICVAWDNADYMPRSEGLSGYLPQLDVYFFHAFDLLFRLPQSSEEYVLAILSALVFPAGMMMLFIKGSLLGLNPVPIFKNIFTIVPEYVTAMVLITCSHVTMMLILGEVARVYGVNDTISFAYLCFEYFAERSFVDVAAVLAFCIIPMAYILMVQFRIMAVLYYIKGEEFE